MSLSAFSKPGRFFRGNIHTHSNRSDGLLSPRDVCQRYADRGYDFICLSDHFLDKFNFPIADTRAFRSETFTTIIGAEVHAPVTHWGEKWHILAVGLPLDFAPTHPDEDGASLARRCAKAGAFVVLAHPEWYALTLEDAAQIETAHAVEIYNHTSHLRMARGGGSYFLDALLNGGRRVNAVASDDAHFNLNNDDQDAFGGWVMVKALENDPDALVEALKAGDYYSSQGPEIHDIRVNSDEVRVHASPAAQIMVLGRGRLYAYVSGKNMETATLPVEKFSGDWWRVVVMDAEGKCAWSNPIFDQL